MNFTQWNLSTSHGQEDKYWPVISWIFRKNSPRDRQFDKQWSSALQERESGGEGEKVGRKKEFNSN